MFHVSMTHGRILTAQKFGNNAPIIIAAVVGVSLAIDGEQLTTPAHDVTHGTRFEVSSIARRTLNLCDSEPNRAMSNLASAFRHPSIAPTGHICASSQFSRRGGRQKTGVGREHLVYWSSASAGTTFCIPGAWKSPSWLAIQTKSPIMASPSPSLTSPKKTHFLALPDMGTAPPPLQHRIVHVWFRTPTEQAGGTGGGAGAPPCGGGGGDGGQQEGPPAATLSVPLLATASADGTAEGQGTVGGGKDVQRAAVPVVVLLGWLGAEQRHLRRFAAWYNSQGFDVIAFIIPFRDLLSTRPADAAEVHVDALAEEITRWLLRDPSTSSSGNAPAPPKADSSGTLSSGPAAQASSGSPFDGKHLLFHTFSNTGWLAYGAVLQQLHQRHGREAVDRVVRGCVVDSAPSPEPDPQVWARGFSAAILRKRSSMTQGGAAPPASAAASALEGGSDQRRPASAFGGAAAGQPASAPSGMPGTHDVGLVEGTLLSLLRAVFSWLLDVPAVKSRLDTLTTTLAQEQPPCPQLYIYSRSDRVIPAEQVERFIAAQRAKGRTVHAWRLEATPHVEHFRAFPEDYAARLQGFLRECLPDNALPLQQGGGATDERREAEAGRGDRGTGKREGSRDMSKIAADEPTYGTSTFVREE